MSINLMFNNVNNEINKKKIVNAVFILKDIWIKYPQNIRIFEEIKKLKKRTPTQTNTSLNQSEVNRFFKIHETGKTLSVINNLQLLYKKDSHDFYVLSLLGIFNSLVENYEAAIKYQELSIKLNPLDAGNYLNLSLTLEKKGNLNLALSFIESATLLDYHNININLQLARLYSKLDNYLSSYLIYKKLVVLDEFNFEINLEYAKSLINLKKFEDALIFINKIKFKEHEEDKILVLKGLVYFKLNNFIKSKELIFNALKINKENDNAYTLLGSIFEQLGHIDKAIKYNINATKLNNKNHIALNNLAACYSFVGEVDLSISTYKEVIKINPQYFHALYCLGQMQIYKGEFNDGWLNFEKRWQSPDYFHKKLETSKPFLDKLDDKNLRILAWNEQGVGDQVMYGSMFNELSNLTSKLSVIIDKRLINLFKRNHPKINFVSSKKFVAEDEYDFHIPFGHIGKHLRSKKEDFKKSNFPYICGNINTKKFIVNKYKKEKNILVGLSWTSSNKLLSDNKNLTLESLSPILKIKNIKFISLEFKDTTNETDLIRKNYGIEILKEDTIDNFNDIEGLSSIIEACDFIISCSNTNAHLSGALNKKTYLLLPLGKGRLWNWSTHNGFSLWYPKTKVFQQKNVGDWDYPINALREEIIDHKIKIN